MTQQIEISYNHEKKRLTIFEGGKPVGGFCGKIATRMMKKIAINNSKVEVENGKVRIGIQ